MSRLIDGDNVMGSRPDGWWRDRPAGRARLVEQLAALGEPVTVVFDGRGAESVDEVEVVVATPADDEVARRAGPGVTVVTSDAELADRCRAAGAEVVGAGGFLRRLG